MNVKDDADLHFEWYHRVGPLLQEYFYIDVERLHAVLALDPSKLSPTIYEVLFGRADVADAIRRVRDKTSLLPSNRELAIGEVELRDSFRREERLNQVLETLHYDYVVLDCPPNLGLLVVNALVAANLVIVPVSTPLAYRGTSDLFEIMAELKTAFNASWDIRALQTFYRQGVLESESLRERLEGDFGEKLFDSRINLNTDISVATSSGRPLLEFSRSSGYLDYRRLAEEVLHATEEFQAQRDARPTASTGSHR